MTTPIVPQITIATPSTAVQTLRDLNSKTGSFSVAFDHGRAVSLPSAADANADDVFLPGSLTSGFSSSGGIILLAGLAFLVFAAFRKGGL